MADRFAAEIKIGGRIPYRLLDKLAEMIMDEGAGINWDRVTDKGEIIEAIKSASDRGQTAAFTDDQAAYGQFEHLENWLTGRGIDFDRHSEARYEYDGENVYGRGRRRPDSMGSDQDGCDLVNADQIREVLARKLKPDDKLRRIARMVSRPPALSPVVLTGHNTSLTG